MKNKLQKLISKIARKPDMTTPVFGKETIDDINLIRHRLKDEFGETPEISDPRILEELIDCAFISKDAISRSHIRKLMESLGEPWLSAYNESNQRRIADCNALK